MGVIPTEASDIIRYVLNPAEFVPSQLTGFFVGWPDPPSAECLLRMLANSSHCVLAYDSGAKRVVGFINCISDGILSAYIPLLEVLPEYQHRGIGTKLVERMLEITSDFYMIDLACDANAVPFYRKLGLQEGIAMSRRNYNRQNGNSRQSKKPPDECSSGGL